MATTTPTDELPRMAVQDQIDDLLTSIASLTANIRTLEAELADAKATLTDFFAAGEVDQSFQHNDWSFTYTRGRTTFQYSDEAKKAIGISPGFIRVSVGIEDIEDIIADFEQALKASQK